MTKVVLGLLALILIIGGGYYGYTTYMTEPQATENAGELGAEDKVQIQDVTAGTGAEATPGSTVHILYAGLLPDGTVFDSSAMHNNEPLVFVLGGQGIIPGFQVGINGMKEGGERVIVIPPALGYGSQAITDGSGKVIIPANTTLTFQVRLEKVEAPAAPATEETAE